MRVTAWRLLAGAAAVALVSGVIGGLAGALLRSGSGGSSPGTVAGTGACDVSSVAAQVLPSLVTINVRGASGGGTGSGSVLDTQGDILTNNHVVEVAASGGSVTVDFARGKSQVPATIVGRDPATDLAVVKVQSSAARLTPISIGDSANLVLGEPVVAAGSPLGLSSTITTGIVSALSRYVNVGAGDQPSLLVNAIQTDAAINPGNSGGPLMDCRGRQIGVNSAGAQVPTAQVGGSIGLNFAIPIDFAKSVANQIIETGRVTHPIIGVLGVTVTEEFAKATGLPRGALIQQVVPGLGGAQAGLQPGDVITRVGDEGVNSVDRMLVALRQNSPGSTVQVGYSRGGSSRTVGVPVAGAPVTG